MCDAGELTFVGLRVVDQQNLLIASNGTAAICSRYLIRRSLESRRSTPKHGHEGY